MTSQMEPAKRTVGELIEILSQYPLDTPISGVANQAFTNLCTVQGNSPDCELNNVGIYFWTDDCNDDVANSVQNHLKEKTK